MRGVLGAASAVATLTVITGTPGDAGARDDPSGRRATFLPKQVSVLAPFQPTGKNGFLPSEVECRVSGGGPNLNLDCDHAARPNNEPHIAVDPTDPDHLVASSNDYDSNLDQFYTSFDGGRSWVTGDMSAESGQRVGSDPVTSFDVKHDDVLHSSLNFLVTPDNVTADWDLVVSRSKDGGVTWGRPVIVAGGRGNDLSPAQVVNDKEWIVTDNNPESPFYGRTYLTWSRFLFHDGFFAESPVWLSYSDDGGRSWSKPHEISGRSPTCTFQETGGGLACDEDVFAQNVVAPDGTVYVSFINYQHDAAWEPGDQFETQYMVVRSTDGGRSFSDPVSVVDMEDGDLDYPFNVDGNLTLTGFQARVWTPGNIAADPRSGRLYLVFSDNRAGERDTADPVTNTNVYLMTSKNGRSWRGPRLVAGGTADQWFPWVDVNPRNGEVGVLYHQEVGRGRYVTRLATGDGSDFERDAVSTAVSDAFDSRWFQAGPDAGDCATCSAFFGDYISLAYGRDGTAHVVWTDMRRRVTFEGATGHTENIFYARR